jgi:acetoin utilization protein AcuB
MSAHPVVVHDKDDYKHAFDVMEHKHLRHLPVVDEQEQLVGILAERDLLLAATQYLHCTVEVGDVMHRQVITVTPEMRLDQAAMLMAEHHIGGLPVVNGGNGHQHVVGMITESDIFRTIARGTH